MYIYEKSPKVTIQKIKMTLYQISSDILTRHKNVVKGSFKEC